MARLNESWDLTAGLFVRSLAAVYLIAAASLWVQADGLIGPDGVLPLDLHLRRLDIVISTHPLTGWPQLDRWLGAPTLSWWLPSAWAPTVLCAACCLGALAALLGRLQGPALLLCWLTYGSLMIDGQRFLQFQWDSLLLEVGFAALLIAPGWSRSQPSQPPVAGRWLLRWILFRLMLFSGVVKLTSGDPTWWDGTAMSYHYLTQPLPNPLAWYAHHLPMAWHQLETLLTFVVELVLSFLIFANRRLRLVAFAAFAGLMGVLATTGNYGFFQLLTLVLCLSLIDDGHLQALSARVKASKSRPAAQPRQVAAGLIAVLLFTISLVGLPPRYLGRPLPPTLETVRARTASMHLVNHYGLFANMTTTRPIPILEARWGDGEWTELTWRWQSSDPSERPALVAPHMPRLDWLLWFAGLGGCTRHEWARAVLLRVVQGSEPVAELIGDLRLAGHPPDDARFTLYEYAFAAPGSPEAQAGQWWTRRPLGPYCPVTTRRPDGVIPP